MKPLVAGRIHYRDPADQIVLSALISPAPAERDFCAATDHPLKTLNLKNSAAKRRAA